MAFIRLPGHYVFDYKPIYYDPKKEDREKRTKRIREELGMNLEEKKKLKPTFDFKTTGIYRKKRERTSAIRLVIILTFLMLVVYILFFTNYFDVFSESLFR